jgi:hypothetical protein
MSPHNAPRPGWKNTTGPNAGAGQTGAVTRARGEGAMPSMTQSKRVVQGTPDRRTWQAVDAPGPANGLWLKWETIGDEVDGEWRGISTGKFGEIGTVATTLGPKNFSLPISLARQVRRVPVGAPILISFTGEMPTKSGGSVKIFSVLVPPDIKLLEVKASEPDPENDRVPF